MTRSRSRRGYMLADLFFAVVLAGTILLMLTLTLGRMKKAERSFESTRAADRRLESAIFSLAQGQTADPDVTVERLPEAAPPGWIWVRVSVTSDSRPRTLIGLARLADGRAP